MDKKEQNKNVDDYFQFCHIGWGSAELQFNGYIEGYKKAGDILIGKVLKTKDISLLDSISYPALFLYRQFLELQLKEVYLFYSKDSKDEKKAFLGKSNHDLIKVWKKIKPIVEKAGGSNPDKDLLAKIEGVIFEFDKYDKSSFFLRYPIKKDLTKVFDSPKNIYLPDVKERINEVFSFFFGITSLLEEEKYIAY